MMRSFVARYLVLVLAVACLSGTVIAQPIATNNLRDAQRSERNEFDSYRPQDAGNSPMVVFMTPWDDTRDLGTMLVGANFTSTQAQSVSDRTVVPIPYRFTALSDATMVPFVSPVRDGSGDFVYTTSAVPGTAGKFKIVVKKPVNPNRSTKQIPTLSSEPEKAWSTLNSELEDAADNHIGTIIFPPNQTVHLRHPSSTTAAHLPIKDLSDVVIDLNGCELILDYIAPGVVISNCQRVKLTNGVIRSEHLISSIAVAEADPESGSPTGIRFRILDGWLSALEAEFAGDPELYTIGLAKPIGRGKYRLDAVGSADVFANRGKKTNLYAWGVDSSGKRFGYFRPTSASNRKQFPYKRGDHVYMLHHNNSGNGITLKNDDGDVEDITIEDVDLVNIPGMGITGDVNRGVHIKGGGIIQDSGTVLSVWGSASDAIHINNNGGDIVVEDFTFGGSADDLFTAKGNWWKVESISGNTITVNNAGGKSYGVQRWANRGDRLVGINGDLSVRGESTMMAASIEGKGKRYILTLAAIPEWLTVGTLVANPDQAGGRILVRNSAFANSRAQGTLIQARGVVVENNTYTNIAGPAIKLNFELNEWHESVFCGEVLIKDNTITNCGVGATKPQEAIYMKQKDDSNNDVEVLNNIQLTGNTYSEN